MTKVKERNESRGMSRGYGALAEGVGNSLYLTRGTYVDYLHEVWEKGRIQYGVGNRFNECTHITEISSEYPAASQAELLNDTWWADPGSYSGMTPPTLSPYGNSVPHGLKPKGTVTTGIPFEQAHNARLDGYNRLINQPSERFSNHLRAAMELKDTKQTLNPLINFVKWGQSMQGRSTHIGRLFKRFSYAWTIAQSAKAYLWYRFGVEPTVSDVNKFRNELEAGKLTVRGRKPQLIPRGSVVVGRYSALPKPADITALMFPNASGGHGSWVVERECSRNGGFVAILPDGIPDPMLCRRVVVSDCIKGCYFAQVRKEIVISGIGTLRRAFGWNCPALRTLWDLTPFSFLVDWLVDVGGAIERLEKRYLRDSFETHYGPVWIAERTEDRTYMPGISSFRCKMVGTEPPAHPYTGGRFKIDGEVGLSYWIQKRVSRFVRGPASSIPALAIPSIDGIVNAYRLSTGMALLLQAVKGLR